LKKSIPKWQSPPENSREKSSFLKKLTGFVSQFWIFDHTLSCFVSSSLHLYLSCSVPKFLLVPLRPLVGLRPPSNFFIHCLSPPVLSRTHSQKAFSRPMLVLSHSDTHYLNRHMVGCWGHEILIPCSTTVLFSTSFLLISISRLEG
jgi:hypothetical protein